MSGTVFEITDAELAAADRYEQLAAYKRVAAMLASGKQAWVYVDARSAPGARKHRLIQPRVALDCTAATIESRWRCEMQRAATELDRDLPGAGG